MAKKLYTATFTLNGKRYYVRSSVSQRDAERKAAKRQADLEAGLNLITPNMLVADYAMKWLETYKTKTVSENVSQDYKGRIKNHIIPEIGGLKMCQVKPSHLQNVLNAKAGYSKNFYVKLENTLKGIFSAAVYDGIIATNPATRLVIPKSKDGTHRSITSEERAAILSVAETHTFGGVVKTMLYCGLRPQEAIALQWQDVDRINHRLNIRRALKKDGQIAETKTAAGARSVPIPPAISYIFESPGNLTDHIFTPPNAPVYRITIFRAQWRSFLREVDIALGAEWAMHGNMQRITKSVVAEDLTPYCLRHTYCTDLEAAGVPINVAKYLMGHSNISVTAQIYTHMREDTLQQAAEKIAAFGATPSATGKPSISVLNGNKEETHQIKNAT